MIENARSEQRGTFGQGLPCEGNLLGDRVRTSEHSLWLCNSGVRKMTSLKPPLAGIKGAYKILQC